MSPPATAATVPLVTVLGAIRRLGERRRRGELDPGEYASLLARLLALL